MASFWELFSILFAIFFPFKEIIAATDIINTSLSITDGESLVSSGGRFELGFFTPGSSRYRYLGLWYKNHTVPTILWVANREAPLTNRRGALRVINPGLLVLLNDTNQTIWSSHSSTSVNNPVAQLLDSGNIVVRDVNDDNKPENYLWQSFDYPTDTYLPGMKFGKNLLTGLERFLLSWKSADDPAPGLLSFHLDPTGYPQVLLKKCGFVTFRVGPWNGIRFSGAAAIVGSSFKLTFMMNANEVICREDLLDHSVVSRYTLGQTRLEQRFARVDQTEESVIYTSMPSDGCDAYGLCGTNGICNVGDSPPCECLDRFVPKDPQNWVRRDWKSGCIRRANLSCKGDVFLKYSGVKLPDATHSWYNTSMTLEECRRECVKNCSCMAYTQLDISSESGCLFWSGEVIDIRSLSSHGQDIYIRLASSESVSEGNRKMIIASLTLSTVCIILIGLSIFICLRKINNLKTKKGDLPWFDLSTILKATGGFSENNKLGKGGFGTVYMGILKDGQQIAVKRLSKDSTQGHDELKNEIMLIAKLQHRNLVRLLGCCMQGDENLLIYEYLPNKSLDTMLFDQTKRTLLDWPTRLKIVNGIARGLLYLHQDSRLRIIHRDLKASNILLDADMNPKISDFGIARSFEGEETQVRTHRVIGTYGYMSPEYVVNGVFSIKSDVFSFGVLVLEIVSGKRNWGFFHDEHHLNLLGHAWTLYNEGKPLDIVDDSLQDSLSYEEMRKTIHIGLLCVQKWPKDRPSMSSVVFMLGNEGWVIPQAKKPGFFTETDVVNAHNSDVTNSENEITITKPEGR